MTPDKVAAALRGVNAPAPDGQVDDGFRQSLVKALGRSEAPEVVPVLVRHADRTTRDQVAEALAAVGEPAMPAVVAFMRQGGMGRDLGMIALDRMSWNHRGEQGPDRGKWLVAALPELVALVNDPDVGPEARRLAALVGPVAGPRC